MGCLQLNELVVGNRLVIDCYTDAVTVVLYTMMVAFSTMEHISGPQIALGLASFFTSSFGGLSIGIISGLITALITRTTSQVRGQFTKFLHLQTNLDYFTIT